MALSNPYSNKVLILFFYLADGSNGLRLGEDVYWLGWGSKCEPFENCCILRNLSVPSVDSVFIQVHIYIFINNKTPLIKPENISMTITADGLRWWPSSSTTDFWLCVIHLDAIRTRGTRLASSAYLLKATLRTHPAQQLSVTWCLNWFLLFLD